MRKKGGKMFVFSAKKRTIVFAVFLAIFIAVTVAVFTVKGGTEPTSRPQGKRTVVLDAGHGGVDAGVTGKGGLKEADFNLDMVFRLQKALEKEGYSVVLTRKDEKGLYGDGDENFKRADMQARKEIIRSASPDLFISVHANKYPSSDRRGAQAFFDEFNPSGKALAEAIQISFNRLNERYVGRTFSALSGDYYVLKCTFAPSVILECGFLSNPEDEALLSDDGYRDALVEAILNGVVEYSAKGEHSERGKVS